MSAPEETNLSMNIENNEETSNSENEPRESSESNESTSPPGLTLDILKQVKSILDIAISRGVVRPEELSTVGKIYDQYVAGLNTLIQSSNK
jgi:hypothetical protein